MKTFVPFVMLLSSILYSQTASISPLGPEGGVISHLQGSLTDDVVIAIVRERDLYRSSDGGDSWTKIDIPAIQSNQAVIHDLTFHPLSSDTILLPTSFGLYRSADKGLSWIAVQGSPTPKYSVQYAPSLPSVLFGSDDGGVLRSTDGGNTWQPMKDGAYFGNRPIFRISIHPGDNILSTMRVAATTGFEDTIGVFFTANGGTTWNPFIPGLPKGDARKIYTIEIDSTGLGKTDYRILIGTADGVYGLQTDQFGATWQSIKRSDVNFPIRGVVTSGKLRYERFDTLSLKHIFDLYIASNASDYDGPPKQSGSSNGIFKISSNFGTISNFSIIQNKFPQLTGDITSIFIPTKSVNRQKIYIGTTNGVFISTDDGQNWLEKNGGIRNRIIRNIASLTTANSTPLIFAGVFGGGVQRSTDDGVNWQSANIGLTNPYVTAVVTDDKRNMVYAGSAYTIYRSTNAGVSWQALYVPDSTKIVKWNKYSTRENDMTIRISPKNPDLIMFYAGAYGLNVSTNGGQTWTYRQSPPGFDTVHIPENIEFDPIDSLTVYFTGNGIYKSTNLGLTWDFNISSNLPKQGVPNALGGPVAIEMLSPTVNPQNNKEIFLSTVYGEAQGQPFRLFRTTNGGGSWDSLNQPLPVYDVQYDRFDPKRVIASGPGGIFATSDGGTTWKILVNPQPQEPFYLLGSHAEDANIYFVGSEQGGYKIELNDRSKLTVDTTEYNFGSIQVGKDTTLNVFMRNTLGARNVIVQFTGLTDTNAFHILGPDNFDIPKGSFVSFQVQFSPKLAGNKTAVLRFRTTDDVLDSLQFILRGHSFERYSLEKFTYDFGSVTVGKDSVVEFEVDNLFGLKAITLNYIGNSDTASFKYEGGAAVVIDTGQSVLLPVRFTPASTGVKQTYMVFTTTDPRFPGVKLRFQGTGVARNFKTRRVLFDDVGFVAHDSSRQFEYFNLLKLSLERADIKVDTTQLIPFSNYNAAVYVQPEGPPQSKDIDSLQKFVLNGGTIVALGDFGIQSASTFNLFLHDTTWKKHNVKIGIQFNTDLIADISLKDSSLAGYVAAYPVTKNVLTYGIDSVVLFAPGSLKIDTTVNNVIPLLAARSPDLVSVNSLDSSVTPILFAPIAAYSQVGKGKIIVISDYDIWWNGDLDDTTKPYGIFGGNNLRFAFNIFGLVDNLLAQLPEPTPQEAYKLISIPYNFTDSSVLALFKDLGPPNDLVWRMFGKWNDKRGAYAEFPEDFKSIRRGEGYWLITKQSIEVNFGTTEVQGTEEDFEILLQPGYNMIGNPFPYEVSWTNSFKADSVERVLWFFDKEFDTTSSVMKPFKGYFIKNRGKTAKTIKISSTQLTSTSSLPKSDPERNLEPQEWKLQISALSKRGSDELNYIGMLNNSVDGIDDEDFSEPPTAPTDYLSLSIRNNGDRLAADYKPLSREGQYWDINVSSSTSGIPVTIVLNKIGTLPSDFKIFILHVSKERVHEVTQSLSHVLTFDKKEQSKEIRILVGNQQFVESNTNGIPIIPLEYSLAQNFPNPFNPATSIRYSLSNSSHVKLEIFNTLGQRVKSLVQEFQPIGTYVVAWNGTDDGKKAVASGVYYYRLQANNYTNVKKMTLIK
ncbi:MAG: choice-of-anchor D domain-containing protein [Ignavibacteriales bacterium]|nr:choice-of-anchor D domain-containing protein [Ignavibacteriales bacterium]